MRNRGREVGYKPGYAQQQAKARRWVGSRLEREPTLRRAVLERLAEGWSPEQVAGRFAREAGRKVISYESIYRFIYAQIARTKDYRWRHYLPRAKSKRGLRGRRGGSTARLIEGRVSVAERPPAAAERTTAGHWEADTILFAKYGQAALAVHERQTRIILRDQTARQNRRACGTTSHSAAYANAASSCARPSPSTTAASSPAIASCTGSRSSTYFCDPYSPWQKGGMENAIGRLRRFLPRKTDLATLPDKHFQAAISAYNNTPRKCLDFRTPAEAFSEVLHFKCKSTSPLSRGRAEGRSRAGETNDKAVFDTAAMLAEIRGWVEIESPTTDAMAVNRMVDHVEQSYAGTGAHIERIAGRDGFGDHLIARSPWGQANRGILILSHLDTVHPIGFIERLPFRVDGDIAYGPGIYDMKAGAFMAFHAFREMDRLGTGGALPVTHLYVSEEEVGSPTSRAIIEARSAQREICAGDRAGARRRQDRHRAQGRGAFRGAREGPAGAFRLAPSGRPQRGARAGPPDPRDRRLHGLREGHHDQCRRDRRRHARERRAGGRLCAGRHARLDPGAGRRDGRQGAGAAIARGGHHGDDHRRHEPAAL